MTEEVGLDIKLELALHLPMGNCGFIYLHTYYATIDNTPFTWRTGFATPRIATGQFEVRRQG